MIERGTRPTGRRRFTILAGCVALVVALAACGSSKSTTGSNATTTSGPSATTGPQDTSLGTGVTATTIKIGVAMVDYDCIKQFIDFNRGDQKKTYQTFIDNVNKTGINGRKLVPVFQSFCPIGSTGASTVCTQFTEDDKVFAVIGVFIDSTGAAQLCVSKQHNTVLISHELSQDLISKSPPGLMLTPDITAERQLNVVLALLKQKGTLTGKKVGILAETGTQPRIASTIKPALQDAGATVDTVGVLATGTSADTTAAMSQLSSYLEHWKTDNVDAIVVSGLDVVSKNFIEALRAQLPNVLLITDATSSAKEAAQDETKAGKTGTANPYQGMLAAQGYSDQQTFETPSVQKCVNIYETATGTKVISPTDLKPGSDGHRVEVYQAVEDACDEMNFFTAIATKTGKYLNNANWTNTVNNYGEMTGVAVGHSYASLKTGKYDADDSFGLVSFDTSLGEAGDWKALTPVENVAG